VFPVYPYVHTTPTSSFRCCFVRPELLSPYSVFALTLLLIVMTRMSTYISPMYYAVFRRLIINVLSILSSALHLESLCLDFIWTSEYLPSLSIGQDSRAHPIHPFCGVSTTSLLTGCHFLDRSHLPVSGHLNYRPASGHPTSTWDNSIINLTYLG
jgi:hypothetical protein